jgi:hypothetical protein
MPALNETIVEEAALTWFGEHCHTIGRGPDMALGDVVLVSRFRDAITHLNPAMHKEVPAVISILENTAPSRTRRCNHE